MALCRGLPIADPPPAAERAFASIGRQRWRLRPAQISGQLAQGLIELMIQGCVEGKPLLLQTAPSPSNRQGIRHGSLLNIG